MPEKDQSRAELIADEADLAGGMPLDLIAFCIVHDFTVEESTNVFKQYAETGYYLNGSSSWGEPKKVNAEPDVQPAEPKED